MEVDGAPQTGARALRKVYVGPKVYRGPYRDHGPDLVPGYQRGYRVAEVRRTVPSLRGGADRCSSGLLE